MTAPCFFRTEGRNGEAPRGLPRGVTRMGRPPRFPACRRPFPGERPRGQEGRGAWRIERCTPSCSDSTGGSCALPAAGWKTRTMRDFL